MIFSQKVRCRLSREINSIYGLEKCWFLATEYLREIRDHWSVKTSKLTKILSNNNKISLRFLWPLRPALGNFYEIKNLKQCNETLSITMFHTRQSTQAEEKLLKHKSWELWKFLRKVFKSLKNIRYCLFQRFLMISIRGLTFELWTIKCETYLCRIIHSSSICDFFLSTYIILQMVKISLRW